MRRRIMLTSALSAAMLITAAPAAFAGVPSFDLGDLGRNAAALFGDLGAIVGGLF